MVYKITFWFENPLFYIQTNGQIKNYELESLKCTEHFDNFLKSIDYKVSSSQIDFKITTPKQKKLLENMLNCSTQIHKITTPEQKNILKNMLNCSAQIHNISTCDSNKFIIYCKL